MIFLYGYPVANSTAYVVSIFGNLLPNNIVGELWVGGDGVSNGYLNKPELTLEKFINNPFGKGKIYKTGDLTKFLSNGAIKFIGRMDNQVKIRGFRIELSEINYRISHFNNINEVYTTISTINGEKSICTYFSSSEPIDIFELKKYLSKYLPYYMIPVSFTNLTKLPINTNGKVDKKLLPEPKITNFSHDFVEPRNETDKKLLSLVCDVLSLDKVSLADSFINIGGDSLLAITLSLNIYSKFKVKVSVQNILESKSLMELSDIIMSSNTSIENIQINKAEKSKYYPLSSAQKRIFYTHSMLGNDNIVYNISGGILMPGIIDESKINMIFKKIIQDNSSFRTSFSLVDYDIKQIVHENVPFAIKKFTHNNKIDINNIINNFTKHFDLSTAPLLRAEIHYINNSQTLLLIDSHHIIIDGSSLNLLIKEFCDLYNGVEIKNNSLEYVDFSVWENEYINSEEIKKSKEYWINQFKDFENYKVNLPTDYPIPNQMTYQGAKISKTIPVNTFKKLENLAKKLGVSPYVLFVSAFFILLNKYSMQTDITVGTPTSGRLRKEFENIIGMFVNTLVLKANVDNNLTTKDFILKIKDIVLSALEHNDYPYDILVKDLNLTSTNMSNPLFNVLFTYQNNVYTMPKINNKELKIIEANTNISKFDLSLEIVPHLSKFNLEFSTDIYNENTMNRFLDHYINILSFVLNNINTPISNICMLSDSEKNFELNNTVTKQYNLDTPVFKLFENYAKKLPDNIAITYKDKKLTYKEANSRINKFARYFKSLGINSNDIVPICMNKNIDFVCCILAIQKLGAAYLPIHPDYPVSRINYIINNSNSKFIITDRQIPNIIESIININDISLDNLSEENLNIPVFGDNLAYIIYTSGSTGNPKGIKITHKNLLNFIYSFNDCFKNKFNEKDNCLTLTNIAFDVSVCELFVPFTFGANLVIYPENTLMDIPLLYNTIKDNNVTFLYIPPNVLDDVYKYIYKNSRSTSINKILVGVEPIKNYLLNNFYTLNPDIEIVNGYGPSETTICCTFYKHNTINNPNDIVPIGRAVTNNNIYILDNNLNLSPVGVPGEICVSGSNVSLGYLNNDELTFKSFIKNPFNENSKIYKTGDIGILCENGNIKFIGRNDNQIKYKGYRIELNEITSIAKNIKDVTNAVALIQKINNIDRLCLYVTIASKNISRNYIREELHKTLPYYMIPSHIIILENLPITLNGKIDKKKLPLPTNEDIINKKDEIIPPSNNTEKLLLDIFKKILNKNDIGITSNFFEMGGDSLLAMRVQVEAISNNLKITYSDIFIHPTVYELANLKTAQSTNDNSLKDYSKYDEMLSSNTITNNMNFEYSSLGNVLLTGVTGFLGVHILDSFMKKEKGNIYCLIRAKGELSPEQRLKNTLLYYFGDKYINEINKRIFVVDGSITEFNLNLSEEEYEKLGNTINTVIHAAALVKHYGNIDAFKTANVKGTQKILDFCEKFNLKLMHISTISVSGNVFADSSYIENNFKDDVEYSETNFYINQNLDNVYIKSKFYSEALVFDAIKNGLNAYVFRIGNLTNRFSDCKFQPNYKENAFVNRFKSILKIGYAPDYLLDLYTEFTPVDYCADAIILLASHYNPKYSIFHLHNDNHVTMKRLYNIFKQFGISIQSVSSDKFANIIENLSKDENKKKYLDGIINDLTPDKQLVYDSHIKIKSQFSKYVLNKIGFNWPLISDNYIYNYLKYFIDVGYFNIKF